MNNRDQISFVPSNSTLSDKTNTHPLPDAVLSNLRELKKSLHQTEFWKEVLILDAICYKNTNQHRSSLHFRKLKLISRLLSRLKSLKLDSNVADLIKAPAVSAEPLHSLATRLISVYTLLERIVEACKGAYMYHLYF
jgi:hypothetical protein